MGFLLNLIKPPDYLIKILAAEVFWTLGFIRSFLLTVYWEILKPLMPRAEFAETGMDSSCTINFKYANEVEAQLHSTVTENTPTTAEIIMEKGIIKLNSRFHEPTSVTIISEGKEETIEFGVDTNGYNFEAEHVAQKLRENKTESDIMSLDRTLEITRLLDQIRKEINLEY